MTTAHDIDWPTVLADLTTTHPDVLRELFLDVHPHPDGAEADALLGAGLRRAQRRAHQLLTTVQN